MTAKGLRMLLRAQVRSYNRTGVCGSGHDREGFAESASPGILPTNPGNLSNTAQAPSMRYNLPMFPAD